MARCTQDTENNSIFLVCVVITLLQKDTYDFLNFYLFDLALSLIISVKKVYPVFLKMFFEKT